MFKNFIKIHIVCVCGNKRLKVVEFAKTAVITIEPVSSVSTVMAAVFCNEVDDLLWLITSLTESTKSKKKKVLSKKSEIYDHDNVMF